MRRDWEKARRRRRREEDWAYRKLGAQTPKRDAYNRDVQARLKRDALRRLEAGHQPAQRPPGAEGS